MAGTIYMYFKEGMDAFAKGIPYNKNPYPIAGDASKSWDRGWDEAWYEWKFNKNGEW